MLLLGWRIIAHYQATQPKFGLQNINPQLIYWGKKSHLTQSSSWFMVGLTRIFYNLFTKIIFFHKNNNCNKKNIKSMHLKKKKKKLSRGLERVWRYNKKSSFLLS